MSTVLSPKSVKGRGRASVAAPKRSPVDPYFAQVIGKTMRALEMLRASGEPLSLDEIAKRMGGAKTSVYRILHSLESLEYLEKAASGRKYILSAKFRRLERAPFLSTLLSEGLPRLRQINREFKETASLAALFDNHIEAVAVVESPHILRMVNKVGRILPPHASSLGKCIAAFQTEERQDQLVHSYGIYSFTPHTITGEADMKREFERIRKQGYSTDREESGDDGICVGAPIPIGSHVVAAISISAPKARHSKDLEERMVAYLRKVTRELSQVLST
jgi:IclR family acetate operon transcriptional repressor